MKKTVFLFLMLIGFNAFAQNGIVNVETVYTEVYDSTKSLKFSGRGFVVDYPIISQKTQRTVHLKVVLTAAHLVFGGIYENRSDNYKIFESESNKELFSFGMISDVIHDTAVIILCTQEAVDFFGDEISIEGQKLKTFINRNGQSFQDGGACAFQGKGQIVKDVNAFATYSGKPLNIQADKNENSWILDDKSLSASKLIVNSNQKNKFLVSDKTYAVPFKNDDLNNENQTLETSFLKSNLNPLEITEYTSLTEIPREHVVSFNLKSGYSGSPILYFDTVLNELVVSGVYKASTQSVKDDVHGNHGWVAPVEMSYGLLNILINRYSQNVHRWHTVPQAYIFLNKGILVRTVTYPHFLLFEDVNSEENQLISSNNSWVRSDTGETMWVRSDTGENVSTEPQRAKQLKRGFYQDNETFWEDTISFLALPNADNKNFILLPPTLNAMMMSAEYNCPTCINAKSYSQERNNSVVFFSQDEEFALVDTLWLKLNLDQGTENAEPKTKTFVNPSKVSKTKFINVTYSVEGERIKIQLNWLDDLVEFYILENNSIAFVNMSNQWEEMTYASVLEIKTQNGNSLLLETAGIIYYNTELPNPSSFRFKLRGSKTELFESQELL